MAFRKNEDTSSNPMSDLAHGSKNNENSTAIEQTAKLKLTKKNNEAVMRSVRLPKHLNDEITQLAKNSNKSINATIVELLTFAVNNTID